MNYLIIRWHPVVPNFQRLNRPLVTVFALTHMSLRRFFLSSKLDPARVQLQTGVLYHVARQEEPQNT